VSVHGAVCAEPRGHVAQPVQGAAPVGLHVVPSTHEKMHCLFAAFHVAAAEHVHCARPVAVVAAYSAATGHVLQYVAPGEMAKVPAAQRRQAPVAVAEELPGWHAPQTALDVAEQAAVVARPAAQVQHGLQGSTPEALKVAPATQGAAARHELEAELQYWPAMQLQVDSARSGEGTAWKERAREAG